MSSNVVFMKSPTSGVFYGARDPGAPPFVEAGYKVETGDVVCVIESMKVLMEVRTERAGTVQAILMENESEVTTNQPLTGLTVGQ